MSALGPTLADLYARASRGIRLGLEPMQAACARFGHPERDLDVVHVAGTNGKGSVSAMVESAARQSGLRTGLYTSPHLSRFAERIRLDGAPIDDDVLVPILRDVLAREPELSFFEAATLTALLAFRDAGTQLVVLEVGLGGRLDATNVVPSPRACAVTRIAFDHMDKLGGTLEAIAKEKACIAKRGVPMVIGALSPELIMVIESVARSRGAIPVRAFDDAEARGFGERVHLALAGAHQHENAVLAYAIACGLGLDHTNVERGIAETRWPGRLERIELESGAVLFDAAHNPDGAASLAAALGALRSGAFASEAPKLGLVFGALADKDWPPMLDLVAPLVATRAYAPPKGRAAVAPRLLAARHDGAAFDDARAAYDHVRREIGPRGVVVVCGSISLVGELRAALLNERADPPIAM